MENNDIKGLFIELLNQEELALSIYSKLIGELKEDEVKITILSIYEDEKRHIENAKKILKILDE